METTRLFLVTVATPAVPFLLMMVLHSAGVPVLLVALTGTIAMASAMVALGRDPEPAARNLAQLLMSRKPKDSASGSRQMIALAGTSIGLAIAAAVSGAAATFFCQGHSVPFNAVTPSCLAFAAGFLGRAVELRRDQAEISVLAGVAFFWIAPFYGFFMPPVFLAVGLGARCAEYTAGNIAIATVLLLLGAWLGRGLADWLIPSRRF